MTGRERMDVAMRLGMPDRVPVMCQLSLGHYFLNAGLDHVEVWHDTPTYVEALVRLQRRYGFDGLLVNLPGREPGWRRHVRRREQVGRDAVLTWADGTITVAPPDDNPAVQAVGTTSRPSFDDVEPDLLYYVEPHDLSGPGYPFRWGFEPAPAVPGTSFFPDWYFSATEGAVRASTGASVHAEVFSPFSQLMELLGEESVLLSLIDDPVKVTACLERLTEGAVTAALGHIGRGADAILVSSAFAGAGFISPGHYERFVLPFERKLASAVHEASSAPVYIHTCGAIGDRLELMMASGADGIDTLDPPPLGTVDLAEARRRTAGRVFLKGNLDPVNELLRGTPQTVDEAARWRLQAAASGGGYILSSACSVAPYTPPDNILVLRDVVERCGLYDDGVP